MNAFANYRTTVDGMRIHYISLAREGPNPTPTDGWPWGYWDFPGDRAAQRTSPSRCARCDVIPRAPWPGFAFSTRLRQPGVQVGAHRRYLWVALMRELGHARFAAYGRRRSLVTGATRTGRRWSR